MGAAGGEKFFDYRVALKPGNGDGDGCPVSQGPSCVQSIDVLYAVFTSRRHDIKAVMCSIQSIQCCDASKCSA